MKYQLKCAVWETTLACNMNCSHCGSSAGTARSNELTTDECFHLCEELAGLGCETVALMGGEPFMREDWYSICRCARDLGMEISLVSNGMELPEHIRELRELDPKVVGLSLDGLRETHDSIRREGSFAKVMESLELLREQDMQTTLITTVSKLNFHELPRMKDLILGTKANWQIQVAVPFGNFRKELMITPEEYYAVGLFIAAQRIRNSFADLPVIGAHCFGYFSDVLPGSRGWKGCTAGFQSIGITSDGGVVGCLSLGNDRFIEENLRERSLEDIWNDPETFPYNRKFEMDQLGANCTDCKFGKTCKGGCASMSFNITGGFHNDPYCFRTLERTL